MSEKVVRLTDQEVRALFIHADLAERQARFSGNPKMFTELELRSMKNMHDLWLGIRRKLEQAKKEDIECPESK